jgi:hypothetical protein
VAFQCERCGDEDGEVDVWHFNVRGVEMRMVRWMCGVLLCERWTSEEMRMVRWMCSVSLCERWTSDEMRMVK